ncbi:MAG: 50S ribosomal protein L23 [Desulfobacterales bacterium]|nr:50S ribosomal protein L23 [Desulfobacterales bacterium]
MATKHEPKPQTAKVEEGARSSHDARRAVNATNEKIGELELSPTTVFGGRGQRRTSSTRSVGCRPRRRRAAAPTRRRTAATGQRHAARSPGGRRAPAGRASARRAARCGASGGTVFGPQPRDYAYDDAQEGARGGAARGARGEAAATGAVVVVDGFALAETKTKACGRDARRARRRRARRWCVDREPDRRRSRCSARNLPGREGGRDAGAATPTTCSTATALVVTGAPAARDGSQEVLGCNEHSIRRHPAAAHHREDDHPARGRARRSSSRWHRDANKIEIKQAVEKLFERQGRRRCGPRTSHGKVKRQGRFAGQPPDWKKAYRDA